MTRRRPTTPSFGFDGFGAAVGCAWIAGALSLVLEPLGALTGALAALAVAGWLGRLHAAGPIRHEVVRHDRLGALIVLAAASLLYLDPLPWLSAARGVVLAAGLVPLWVVERHLGRAALGKPSR